MFTGIVEEVGTIAAAGARMKVNCRGVLADTKEGSSIAVNGVCLTAAKVEADGFWCDLSPETLARTAGVIFDAPPPPSADTPATGCSSNMLPMTTAALVRSRR